jgi:CO/xanthine dehydrogenase Mo-binding subunit
MAQVVGRPTPRVEGEEKVIGGARYSADIALPGMLWGKVLRSPIPYGRIKRIDTSKARAVPGVKAVVTGEDVTGMRIGRCIYDMPILADGVVRFIGEKVAAVAAESEEAAEQAADLIEVEYEDLDPLIDPLAAMKADAPLLHPDVLSYKGLPAELDSASSPLLCGRKERWRRAFNRPISSSKIPSRRKSSINPISNRTPAWPGPSRPAARRSGRAARRPSPCASSSPRRSE